jgi:hypothetical protein
MYGQPVTNLERPTFMDTARSFRILRTRPEDFIAFFSKNKERCIEFHFYVRGETKFDHK